MKIIVKPHEVYLLPVDVWKLLREHITKADHFAAAGQRATAGDHLDDFRQLADAVELFNDLGFLELEERKHGIQETD